MNIEVLGALRQPLALRQRISAAGHGMQFHATMETLATLARRSLNRGTELLRVARGLR